MCSSIKVSDLQYGIVAVYLVFFIIIRCNYIARNRQRLCEQHKPGSKAGAERPGLMYSSV